MGVVLTTGAILLACLAGVKGKFTFT